MNIVHTEPVHIKSINATLRPEYANIGEKLAREIGLPLEQYIQGLILADVINSVKDQEDYERFIESCRKRGTTPDESTKKALKALQASSRLKGVNL